MYGLHLQRLERVFRVAAANGAEVLILGAFGCGAFCNPPAVVARAFKKYRRNTLLILRRLSMPYFVAVMKLRILFSMRTTNDRTARGWQHIDQ